MNRESGRIELLKANSGLSHDLDESDASRSDNNEELKEESNYITTGVIIPARQKISSLQVLELSSDAIRM